MKLIPTFLLALLLLGGAAAQLQAQIRVVSTPESRVWITGSSTVNRFTCVNEEPAGTAILADEDAVIVRTALADNRPRVELTVPVQGFDCGRERMNRDFYQALDAERHPAIKFSLIEAAVSDGPGDNGEWRRIKATGKLSIAGTERVVEIQMDGKVEPDGYLHAKGSKALLMTDFGIKPPTAMWGLIQARDEIEVHFHMTAVIQSHSHALR